MKVDYRFKYAGSRMIKIDSQQIASRQLVDRQILSYCMILCLKVPVVYTSRHPPFPCGIRSTMARVFEIRLLHLWECRQRRNASGSRPRLVPTPSPTDPKKSAILMNYWLVYILYIDCQSHRINIGEIRSADIFGCFLRCLNHVLRTLKSQDQELSRILRQFLSYSLENKVI